MDRVAQDAADHLGDGLLESETNRSFRLEDAVCLTIMGATFECNWAGAWVLSSIAWDRKAAVEKGSSSGIRDSRLCTETEIASG